jgi:hypothetical protein
MGKTYRPDELLQLSDTFHLEHPEADESMFDAFLDQRELDLEPDSPVVITDGVVRYLEGSDV